MAYLFRIVGAKKRGKTTLVAELVRRLTRRGLGVAVVKNVHHDAFALDDKGTDTARAAEAGADVVVLNSAGGVRVTMPGERRTLGDVARLVERLRAPDALLVEGFTDEGTDGVSLGGRETDLPPFDGDAERLAEDIAAKCGGKRPQAEGEVSLTVNGERVDLKPFPAAVLSKTLLGALSALKDLPERITSVGLTLNVGR